jgi:hypothetical protein
MTVKSGPGLLSQLNGRVAGSWGNASAPGRVLLRCLRGLQLSQEMKGAGQQPTGDGGGGDVGCRGGGPAGRRRGRTWGGAWPSGGGLLQDPAPQGEPCLVMWPWRTVRSELRTWTWGSGLASAAISPSRRAIGVARASSSPQQSWMIARGIGGRSSAASQVRPGAVHRLERAEIPRSASTACTGSSVRCAAESGRLGGAAAPADPGPAGGRSRHRAAAPPAAAGPGWPHRPCRLQPGCGDCFAAAGVDQVRFPLELLQQLDQPAPAVGRLERHRGARRQDAKESHQLGRVVGQVAVALGTPAASTMATWERLRCTSIPTYPPMWASFPSSIDPRSLGCRAEQGTGPRPTQRQVNPGVVGLAGLEPAASSLSAKCR